MNHKQSIILKHIVSGLLSLTLLSSGVVLPNGVVSRKSVVSASAANSTEFVEHGKFRYRELEDKTVEIKQSYKCLPDAELIIPVIIDNYTVSSIASDAFLFNSSRIKSVTIPGNIKNIGSGAFANCNNLKQVTFISDGLETIGVGAFGQCEELVSIEIPNTVKSVSGFNGCTKLQFVKLNNGLKEIGISAFANTAIDSIEIPSTVETIGERAFYGCDFLDQVKIPDGIKSLERGVFCGCDNLTDIKIPDSVTTIGSGAFDGCHTLTDIKIPDSVTSIGSSAFAYCTGLKSIVIPYGVKSIGWYAFDGCNSLESIIIPPSVTEIGEKVFSYQEKTATGGYSGERKPMKNLTIYGYPDTAAEKYAKAHEEDQGLKFQALPAYPEKIKYEYNRDYGQVRLSWDKVYGADRYGIAVYVAGKWRIQTKDLSPSIPCYITPKNSITPGKTYKVAVAAKVNGKWDTDNAIRNAVTVSTDPLHPANVEYVNLINIPSGHSNQPDYLVSLVKSKMYDDEIFFAQAEGVPDTGGFLVTDDLKNQLNNLENDYQDHWLSTWASTEEAAAHAAKGETDQLVSKYFESGSSAYYGCWAYNMQAELDLLNYYTKIADQALQSYMVYTTLVMIYQSRMIAAQQEAMKVSQQEYLEMYKINEGTLSESTGSTVVWTGKDKYVPELANEIERNFPGRVQAVEKLVRNSEGLPVTDFDIEMDTVVIQVKSGTATGLTRQMVNTSTVTDKIVISYTPDISPTAAVLKSVQEKGFYTFTNVEELLEFLSTH